jgi:CxxC-x17-CxxC domain-containing protein
MDLQDRTLRCASCDEEFVWTAGEQAFYAEHQLSHEPRHCRACKARRSAHPVKPPSRPAAAAATEATCSQCGRPTTVPFRPASGRPVFCRQCYQQRRHSPGR